MAQLPSKKQQKHQSLQGYVPLGIEFNITSLNTYVASQLYQLVHVQNHDKGQNTGLVIIYRLTHSSTYAKQREIHCCFCHSSPAHGQSS